MCVETLRTGLVFLRMIDLRGHMPRFTIKMNVLPSISLRNTINMCWNPQNRACFSEMFNLRGHMPRFTLKRNIFPSISWETPSLYVETLRTVLIFLIWSIWQDHMPRFTLKRNIFPSFSSETHQCVMKPSEQGSFFWDDWFEGSHA